MYSSARIFVFTRACSGTLTVPGGATFSTRQEYLYLCQGWQADLRFLAGCSMIVFVRVHIPACTTRAAVVGHAERARPQ